MKHAMRGLFLISILVTLVGCQPKARVFVRVLFGPLRFELKVNSSGQIISEMILRKEVAISLGPVGLQAGIDGTLEASNGRPNHLFIVWKDEAGNVRRHEYEIGQEFDVEFENPTLIRRISGRNNCIVLVLDELPNATPNGTVRVQNKLSLAIKVFLNQYPRQF
jgi:hypothetical protein